MNKVTGISFIHKGKQYRLHLVYKGDFYGKVPIFYSDDVDNIKVVSTNKKELFIIANSAYVRCITEIDFEIKVWYGILNQHSKYKRNTLLKDIIIAYWYGFSSVINIIKSLNNESDAEKEIRISRLEDIMLNGCGNTPIPIKDNILNELLFVTID